MFVRARRAVPPGITRKRDRRSSVREVRSQRNLDENLMHGKHSKVLPYSKQECDGANSGSGCGQMVAGDFSKTNICERQFPWNSRVFPLPGNGDRCAAPQSAQLLLHEIFGPASRGEVAGDVENQLRGVGSVGVGAAVAVGHDRHVRGDHAVNGVQRRSRRLR